VNYDISEKGGGYLTDGVDGAALGRSSLRGVGRVDLGEVASPPGYRLNVPLLAAALHRFEEERIHPVVV
jgi:hypothetical protein